MLIALRLAIAFALLAPAGLAGALNRPVSALVVLGITALVGEGTARFVEGQRDRGRSTPASELAMIVAAIVVGLVGAWQVAGTLQ